MNARFLALLSSVALAVPLLPAGAVAAGLGFLKNTPLSYFTQADLKLMGDAALQVLNDADPQAAREWQNPRTGYSGKIQGTGKFMSTDGLDCRRLKIWNQAKGIESESVYPVCRDPKDGEWRLASGKELTRS